MKRLASGAAAVLIALIVAGAVTTGAGAQENPYRGTSTTEQDPSQTDSATAACSLSASSGAPGTPITATVSGVTPGVEVRIVFDGADVGKAVADADGIASVTFAIPASSGTSHSVVAVGPTFTEPCGSVTGGFEVLGGVDSRSGPGGSTGVLGGVLPRTGTELAVALLAAVVLLLVGRALLEESRCRRRHAQRAAAHGRVS
jgi:hypothetical protein